MKRAFNKNTPDIAGTIASKKLRKAKINTTGIASENLRKPEINKLGLSRLCNLSGCGKNLTLAQKKFCCNVHRNRSMQEKGLPGGGLPTTYKLEYATTVFETFLKVCEDGHKPTLIPTKGSFVVLRNAKMPTAEGYALYLGVTTQCLFNWGGRYEKFALTMDRLKMIQRSYLINNGLSGRYNPQIAKLLLGVNHGLIERKEVDNRHSMIGIVKMLYGEADRMEEEEKARRLEARSV